MSKTCPRCGEPGMNDRKLEELLNKDGINPTVLSIPGVYELIAEEYNNAVLKALEEEKEDE